MPERDERGRFVPGDEARAAAARGGRRRAERLTPEERRAIALQGLQTIADRDFGGDMDAARAWLIATGAAARRRKRTPKQE